MLWKCFDFGFYEKILCREGCMLGSKDDDFSLNANNKPVEIS